MRMERRSVMVSTSAFVLISSRVSLCALVTKAFSRSLIQTPERYFETVHDSSLPQASQFMILNITEQAGKAVRLQTCVQDPTLPSMSKVCVVKQDSVIYHCVQEVLGSISAWASAVLTKVCAILHSPAGPLPTYYLD